MKMLRLRVRILCLFGLVFFLMYRERRVFFHPHCATALHKDVGYSYNEQPTHELFVTM